MTPDATPAAAPPPRTARIEVFRPGTFTPLDGSALTYSAADLRAVAEAYDPEAAPAPVVVGHPTSEAPAYGWVRSFDWDEREGRLFATLDEIDPAFAEAVRAGRYRKVSLSFFRPDAAANPAPGTWYPRHLGFLGAAAPAVPGLRSVRFAGPAEGVATFSVGLAEVTRDAAAGLFRTLRDFLIEQFGLEKADAVLPGWRIDWLAQAEPEPGPRFAAPTSKTETHPVSQTPIAPTPATPTPADAARREAELARREAALAARERAAAHAAFADRLVAEGRLLPVLRPRVVALLDALPAEASVSFAEGEAPVPAAAALRAILEAQPAAVSFGQVVLPAEGEGPAASFAADGKPVDPQGLQLHAKAQAYQRAHPGTDFLTAVRAVAAA
jgi:hypothetical protein